MVQLPKKQLFHNTRIVNFLEYKIDYDEALLLNVDHISEAEHINQYYFMQINLDKN